MATKLQPPPNVGQDVNSRQWKDWLYSIYSAISTAGGLGTMASQNANNVVISGGTIGGVALSGDSINNTPIGAITPSTGAFTTLGGTTITASTQFSGPGTGLTGTASGLNIGGNATTATTVSTTVASGATGTTQTAGDNSTKIATTAYVQNATTALGLGTMSTQNANNVAITGGSVNGTTVGATTASTGAFTTLSIGTPLGIASGGTNASTASGARTNLGLGTIATQNTGLSVTITTAKLTLAGANGSMTFTNGILTSQTQAT